MTRDMKFTHIYIRANERSKQRLEKYGFTWSAVRPNLTAAEVKAGSTRDMYVRTYDNMIRLFATVEEVLEACRPAPMPSRMSEALFLDRDEVTHVSWGPPNEHPTVQTFGSGSQENVYKVFHRWSGALNYQPHSLSRARAETTFWQAGPSLQNYIVWEYKSFKSSITWLIATT